MKIQCCRSLFEFIFIIHEHYLPITVWMSKWHHIYTMHLLQKLAHVGACKCGKQYKFEIDSLDFRLCEAKFVFKELKQNMILMQIKSWKSLQIWIVKRSEKCVDFKCNIIRNSSLTSAKVKSVFIRPNKINDVFLFFIVCIVLKSHLLVSLFDNSFY